MRLTLKEILNGHLLNGGRTCLNVKAVDTVTVRFLVVPHTQAI